MDHAEETMMQNIQKNTGKTFNQWIELVQKKNFAKHGEVLKFLKAEHGFTHGYANFIAHKAKGSDAGSVEDVNSLIEKQYKGKEHLRPIYDYLIKEIKNFGKDVDIAPKNAYVSLRRKKQFAILSPATKTRFEIQLSLKGQAPNAKLEAITAANAMCSHKINIEKKEDVTNEVLGFIKIAYEKAG